MRDLVPWPGIEPRLPALGRGVLPTGPPGKSLVQVFVWTWVVISPGQIPRLGTAGSFGKYVFNFTRNYQTVFQGGCTLFYSHQQYITVPCEELNAISLFVDLSGIQKARYPVVSTSIGGDGTCRAVCRNPPTRRQPLWTSTRELPFIRHFNIANPLHIFPRTRWRTNQNLRHI